MIELTINLNKNVRVLRILRNGAQVLAEINNKVLALYNNQFVVWSVDYDINEVSGGDYCGKDFDLAQTLLIERACNKRVIKGAF